MTDYAYLGEVTREEFSEIRKAFPAIVGIDTVVIDGEGLIVLGISKEFSDEIIGLHQLIVALWGDVDARCAAWTALQHRKEKLND